jgi:uncharacterized phage-associated protein
MQKLVFFAHGWSLGLFRRPLIEGEVHTWPCGPVITSLHYALKSSGRKGLRDIDRPVLLEDEEGNIFVPSVSKDDGATRALLERVWVVYKDFSGPRLSEMTYELGILWAQVNRRGLNLAIPDGIIESYFHFLDQEALKPPDPSSDQLQHIRAKTSPPHYLKCNIKFTPPPGQRPSKAS